MGLRREDGEVREARERIVLAGDFCAGAHEGEVRGREFSPAEVGGERSRLWEGGEGKKESVVWGWGEQGWG